MTHDTYQLVIGLEVHAQLITESKLFCSDPTVFSTDPNTQVSPISLAHPGTLPVMNKKVIEHVVRLGTAFHCDIEQQNHFARKNYFYPDLPKGYQVSQHTTPICKGGYLLIETTEGEKKIRLNRIHMEEDAGKSIHDIDPEYTCIDLNRAGNPLVEIVTEPEIYSAEEAYSFLTELRKLVRWLGVCDGNMEEGSMRCDANISVRIKGDPILGTRVEVKNLNSIRNVKRAIEIESGRLTEMVKNKIPVVQETRSYDADANTTFALRSKEEADDYRYFPEPDLPPFFISDEYIATTKASMPALPGALYEKYIQQFGLNDYDARYLCSDKSYADFYEEMIRHTDSYKAVANWITGPLKAYCNENKIELDEFPLDKSVLSGLIMITLNGKVSFQNASGKLMKHLIAYPGDPMEAAAGLNLLQDSDESALDSIVDKVIDSMPDKVMEYRNGKKGLIGLFAGQVKKMSKGRADMPLVTKLLEEKLNK